MFRRVVSNSARLLVATLLSAIATPGANGQPSSIEGHWEGALVREGRARIIRVEVFNDGGTLQSRFEIPDLMRLVASPSRVQQDGARVTMRLPSAGEFLLALDPQSGEMFGRPGRDPQSPVTLHLKRSIRPAEIPTREEEVSFGGGDVTLAGTLIKPATAGPHPVTVWLTGRGSSIRGNSHFHRLLAQHGIASLIYDKRGSGRSTGDFARATFEQLANDAVAAVAFLSQRKDIDGGRIGLHGESAGGWVAPVVVTRSRTPIAFVITTAGPAESLFDQQLHAYQAYVRTGGFELTRDEEEVMDEHVRRRLRVAFTGEGRQEFLASSDRVKGTRLARFLLDSEASDEADFDWLRRNDCDPAPHLRKIKTPWLAFFGTRDYIVPPAVNAGKLEQYLTEAGNKDFKIVVLQNADHGMALPETNRRAGVDEGAPASFVWGRTSPDFTETLLSWLLARLAADSGRSGVD